MTQPNRKRLFNIARIAVCAAALWIVVRGVTWYDHVTIRGGLDGPATLIGIVTEEAGMVRLVRPDGDVREIPMDDIAATEAGAPQVAFGLRTAWTRSSKALLILALLFYFPVAFPLAQRFRLLLRAQDINLGFGECVRLTFAGNFLNYATPLGSNAGDLVKAYFAAQHTPHKTEAVTTVVLDRIIGLGTLVLVAAAITALSPGDSRVAILRPYMVTLLGIGVAGAALYFSPLARQFRIPARWTDRFPMLRHVERVDRAVRSVAARPWTLIASFLLTVLLQLLALGSYFVVAAALAMKADMSNVLEFFAYFYTGAMVQALPGPPQGLGTVELAYGYFFAPYGSPSQIVCMALAIRLVGLICSLPGLLVTLTGSYKPRDLEAAIARLEDGPSGDRNGSQSKSDLAVI